MPTIDELKAKVDAARQALIDAQKELSEAVIAAAPFKIGDVMVNRFGLKKAKVHRIINTYSTAIPVGRTFNLNGTLNKRETIMYSFDEWKKIEE